MSEANETGRFVWRDLQTPDPEKAEAFYTGLLGWDVDPIDMGPAGTYRIVGPGKGIGGIMHLDPSAGVPSHWISYIATPSVDDTTTKAESLGATVVVPPMDIPNVGRFSVVIDPQGAAFSPFIDTSGMTQPNGQQSEIGDVAWTELGSKDVPASKSFYTQLFGYGLEEMEMGIPYTVFRRGDVQEAGLFQAPDEMPVSAWTVYFRIANIDESVAKLEELGGHNLSGIIPVPTIGRVATVSDPLGAVFGLYETEAPA